MKDVKGAILVHFPYITCKHPAVLERGRRLVRATPIALHDIWGFYCNLTLLANRYGQSCLLIKDRRVYIRQRQTNTALTNIAIQRIAMCYGRGLTQPLSLYQFAAVHFVESYTNPGRQGRRPADTILDRA